VKSALYSGNCEVRDTMDTAVKEFCACYVEFRTSKYNGYSRGRLPCSGNVEVRRWENSSFSREDGRIL